MLASQFLRSAVDTRAVYGPIFVIFAARFGTFTHCGDPALKAEAYGNEASSTMPRFFTSSSASLGHHPPQLAPWLEQKWRSASDRSRKNTLLSMAAIASQRADVQKETQ